MTGECGHEIDHGGTSLLCLTCQRAKDRRESDARAGLVTCAQLAKMWLLLIAPGPHAAILRTVGAFCIKHFHHERDNMRLHGLRTGVTILTVDDGPIPCAAVLETPAPPPAPS